MNIEHAYAKGLVCIGLNKKARLILHDEYPIMTYYYLIKLRRYSYQGSIDADKVLLVRVRFGQRFLDRMKFFPRAKDLNCKRSLSERTSLITEVTT